MYPTLSHFIKDIFGIQIPLPFNTFGFFVAMAFIGAYWAFNQELIRKEKLGILKPIQRKVTIGEPAKWSQILFNAFFGFLVGFKLVYALTHYTDFVNDPQTTILSSKGNLLAGILFALVFGYWEYYEKNKSKLSPPKIEIQTIHPYELMGGVVVRAAIWGFIGAKVFNSLEYFDDFLRDPVESLIGFSGLTFYGGLICGGAAVLWYVHKNGIKPLDMLDIGAPGMMLGYGLGRFGCHMSGDGDWGIVNLHPKPFSFLPDWLWAYTYPNNVIDEGIPMQGLTGKFSHVLAQPVYPTSIYEALVCLLLFAILWQLRKKIKISGLLFGIYLMMNGLERFTIELIRVNSKYHVAGIAFTQAELIASITFIAGCVMSYWAVQQSKKNALN